MSLRTGVASQAWHSSRESTRPPSPARWSSATRIPVRSCGPRRRRIPTAPRSIRSCGGRHWKRASPPPAASTTWRRCRSAPSSTAWCAWTAPAPWSGMRCCGTTLAPGRGRRTRRRTRRTRRVGEADRRGAGRGDHRDQAALAGRPRARARRRDGGGLPAARLADVAAERLDGHRRRCAPTAATPAAPATSRRKPTATSPTCSSWRCGATARAAHRAGSAGPGRADAGGCGARSRRGRQRRGGAGAWRRYRATASSRSARPGW